LFPFGTSFLLKLSSFDVAMSVLLHERLYQNHHQQHDNLWKQNTSLLESESSLGVFESTGSKMMNKTRGI
jgi:hypothetical protein